MMTPQEIAREIRARFSAAQFPEGFLQKYDQVECLSEGRGTETFLVRGKGLRALYVAKCYDKRICGVVSEVSILKSIENPCFPRLIDSFEDEMRLVVVREYVEGTSLSQYLLEYRPTEQQVVGILAKLCDALTCLHARENPVIHRDLKPENVVVRPDDGVSLIDFEIAREHHDGAEADTISFGTRAYAPPEQYGFAQTDARADIYALGVLMCALLGGTTDVKTARFANPRLQRIALKCAEFSPKDRYDSAARVKRALLRAAHRGVRVPRLLGFALTAALCICLGFAFGRYTDVLRKDAAPASVAFREPLIEQAVRAQLGKQNGEPITQEDLQAVRAIYIFGYEVAESDEPFRVGLSGELRNTPRGNIASLEDVGLLPNLEILYVNYQTLSDIRPVSALKSLRSLDLKHTRVSDLTPAQGLNALEYVCAFDTDVSDVSALAACPRLKNLSIGYTLVTSLDGIAGQIDTLSLRNTRIESLKGISNLTHLETLDIAETEVADLSPLLALPGLTNVTLSESMRPLAQAIAGEVSFKITYE